MTVCRNFVRDSKQWMSFLNVSHLDYKTGTVLQKNRLHIGGICALSSLLDGPSVFSLLALQYSFKVHFHFTC
jgi:hypothetical protein